MKNLFQSGHVGAHLQPQHLGRRGRKMPQYEASLVYIVNQGRQGQRDPEQKNQKERKKKKGGRGKQIKKESSLREMADYRQKTRIRKQGRPLKITNNISRELKN